MTLGQKMPSDMELRLIREAQAGNLKSRNALIEHNIPFIIERVSRCVPISMDFREYIGIGAQAFANAIKHFKESKGLRLLTFAGISIERKLWREWSQRGLIRLPYKPSTDERKYDEDRTRAVSIRHLDAPIGGSENGRTLLAFVKARKAERPERTEQQEANLEAMRNALETLRAEDPRAAAVIELRNRDMTLTQVGEVYNLSRERVRQIESVAMIALKRMLGVEPSAEELARVGKDRQRSHKRKAA